MLVEDSDTGGPSSITVRIESLNLLVSSDSVSSVWNADEG